MDRYLLILVFTFASVCIHLNLSMPHRNRLDRVLVIGLVFLLIHVTTAFVARSLPVRYRYVDLAAPFGLAYGPLLWAGTRAAHEMRLRISRVVVHMTPLLVAFPCYALFLASASLRGAAWASYYSMLYGGMALSWLGYAAWAMYISSKRASVSGAMYRHLISVLVVVLGILALFVLLLVFTYTIKSEPSGVVSSSSLVYLGMLTAVGFIYRHSVLRLRDGDATVAVGSAVQPQAAAYDKSSIPEVQLTDYAARLDDFMASGRYVDPDLTLTNLAATLKMPKHHLSQLFSQHYGIGFSEYINLRRVAHVCRLMESTPATGNIMELAMQSGFRSKPSFYRNFKQVTGKTPVEFQQESGS